MLCVFSFACPSASIHVCHGDPVAFFSKHDLPLQYLTESIIPNIIDRVDSLISDRTSHRRSSHPSMLSLFLCAIYVPVFSPLFHRSAYLHLCLPNFSSSIAFLFSMCSVDFMSMRVLVFDSPQTLPQCWVSVYLMVVRRC